jgi:hypothetical protein
MVRGSVRYRTIAREVNKVVTILSYLKHMSALVRLRE